MSLQLKVCIDIKRNRVARATLTFVKATQIGMVSATLSVTTPLVELDLFIGCKIALSTTERVRKLMVKIVLTVTNTEYLLLQTCKAVRELLCTGKQVVIEFKEFKAKRSLAQNRLLWKWNQEIANHLQERYGQENSAEGVHEVLVRKRYGVRVIQTDIEEPILVRKRTRKLLTKEFTEYLSWLEMYCAEYLKLILTRLEE
ncbi:hypothetical protein CWC22_007265 [Pseudoalteromonas rubra]|uniref:Uncharacterized protein n=1 Tax=Pseudoalteromonas rubra TaxID=43658 RepID=A0A5S3UUM2_9GAMM|nr:recombination protein NinB [Pseudoalteromonas rubra]QPB82806.1 hypothetical protein CWC22_007265 [Pseudoalteromonas rubra]